jgi:hypothetical protein
VVVREQSLQQYMEVAISAYDFETSPLPARLNDESFGRARSGGSVSISTRSTQFMKCHEPVATHFLGKVEKGCEISATSALEAKSAYPVDHPTHNGLSRSYDRCCRKSCMA